MKKFTAIFIAMILAFSAFAISASAEEIYDFSSSNPSSRAVSSQTSIYATSAATAGTWRRESSKSISTNYSTVYGGDVGTYFHMSNVGLPTSFSTDWEREIQGKLYEDDVIAVEIVKEYTLYFDADYGLYTPVYVSYGYANSDTIESDKICELYFSFMVEVASGDLTRNVPSGLINYQFWAN